MGQLGLGASKSKTKSTENNSLNQWSQSQFEGQKSGIMGAIDKYNQSSPYKAYTGPMVAGLSGRENQARDIAGAKVGSTDTMWGDAAGAIRGGMSYDAADPSRYFNPYEDQVVNAAMGDIELQRQRQRVNDSQGATTSGAWGGSRHGVADSLTNEAAMRTGASTAAGLRQSGYRDAVDTGFRQQQGQYQGASMLGDAAQGQQASWMQDANYLNSLGATERDIQQMQYLASRAEFDREAADQLQRLQMELQTRTSLLGMTPMVTNSQSTGKTSGMSVSASIPIGGA